jgi:transcriptional regulator GlxA family with amidase domain
MADLRRVRLEEALRLVQATDLPLKAIARKVGMADEHTLSRAFSRHFGMSPRGFR